MGTYKEADNNARNSYSPDYGYYEGEPRRSSVPEIPALPMDLELYSAKDEYLGGNDTRWNYEPVSELNKYSADDEFVTNNYTGYSRPATTNDDYSQGWDSYNGIFTYPNMKPRDNLSLFGSIDYGNKERYEPSSYSAQSTRTLATKPRDNLALSGDRHFPNRSLDDTLIAYHTKSRQSSAKPRDNLNLAGQMDFTQKASDYAAFTDHSTKTKATPHPQDNLRSPRYTKFEDKTIHEIDYKNYHPLNPAAVRAMPSWYIPPKQQPVSKQQQQKPPIKPQQQQQLKQPQNQTQKK